MKIAAIIPAAGSGVRLKKRTPKALFCINGKPLFMHTLDNLRAACRLYEIVLVSPPDKVKRMRRILNRCPFRRVKVVHGGRTRAESVLNGLMEVSAVCDWVLIHDAARPFIKKAVVGRLLTAARKMDGGGAICGVPVNATVKRVDTKKMLIVKTEERSNLYLAQTPQVFKKDVLFKRYEELGPDALPLTDDAALFDGTNKKIAMVPGDYKNIKITTPEDIQLFKVYSR